MRFLYFLLVLFFMGGSVQQASGTVRTLVPALKACTKGKAASIASLLEKDDLFKKALMQRPSRSRNQLHTPERLAPDALLPCPALSFPRADVCVKSTSSSGTEALFCFLQSLLYPKHSFW